MRLQGTELSKAIEWFQGKEFFDDFAELTLKARFVACQSYAFAEAAGMARKEFQRCRTQRKRIFADLKKRFRSMPDCNSNADAESKTEASPKYRNAYDAEKEAEASWQQAKDMLQGLKNVVDSMRQEIAIMRQELKENNEEAMLERVVKRLEKKSYRFPQEEPVS